MHSAKHTPWQWCRYVLVILYLFQQMASTQQILNADIPVIGRTRSLQNALSKIEIQLSSKAVQDLDCYSKTQTL